MAHFSFLIRFVSQTKIDPVQNRTKSHEKVFVVILNRVPDNKECDDFIDNLPLDSWFPVDSRISDDEEDKDGDGSMITLGSPYNHVDDDDGNDGIPDYSDSDALGLIVEGSGYSLFED